MNRTVNLTVCECFRSARSNVKCAGNCSSVPPLSPHTCWSTRTRGRTLVSTVARGSTRNQTWRNTPLFTLVRLYMDTNRHLRTVTLCTLLWYCIHMLYIHTLTRLEKKNHHKVFFQSSTELFWWTCDHFSIRFMFLSNLSKSWCDPPVLKPTAYASSFLYVVHFRDFSAHHGCTAWLSVSLKMVSYDLTRHPHSPLTRYHFVVQDCCGWNFQISSFWNMQTNPVLHKHPC